MPSKKIQIKKVIPSYQRAQKILAEQYESSVCNVGSYWKGNNIGTGLNIEEKVLLMPSLLNYDRGERGYAEREKEYFIEKSIRLQGKPLELEIGLENDNGEPVSKKNLPLNLEDYVTYKWALSNPTVGTDPDAGNVMFYITDPDKEHDAKVDALDIKDKALSEYLSIKNALNYEKAIMILTNLDIKNKVDYKTIDKKDIFIKLNNFLNISPDNFYKIAKDKDMEVRYKINKLVSIGEIVRVDNKFLIKETGVKIGDSYVQSIAWFREKENTTVVSFLEAKIEE